MNRRDFLKQTSLAAAGSLFIPAFLKGFDGQMRFNDTVGKRLIVLQLSGGNDGLNTVVPYFNDIYYQKRPLLGIKKEELAILNDQMGLNPALAKLKPLFDNGEMAIVNNVGYPNPNRSHFRSLDIWHTGSQGNEYLSTGWLGRYLDTSCDGCLDAHHAIEVDDTISLALTGKQRSGFAFSDVQRLRRGMSSPVVQAALKHHHDHEHSENVEYLYKTLATTASSADYLSGILKNKQAPTAYPNHPFGRDLQQIAGLMAGGCNARVYYASIAGFDTHNNQRMRQEKLLEVFAESVSSLVADLKQSGQFKETLIFAFSEFGRRVEENGSKGTDHGQGNVTFLLGGGLKKPGFYNAPPSLDKLQDGDLGFEVDFRQIYSEILKRWLDADASTVMGADFAAMGLV